MRYFLAAITAAFLSWAWSDAEAATATGSFNVKVTIAATCVVNSATDMDFGTQGVLGANVDQTNTMTISCTNPTPYNIGLDKGLNGSSTSARQLKSAGGATINYSLFSDSGRTTNWGNVVGTDTVAATGNGAAQSFTVYGRIPSQTTPAPALYTDTITITVTY